MSHAGNCYDNGFIESFWSSLKYELVYHQRFAAPERADARGEGLGGGWANRITLPLLRMEKRWLFGQLARELS